jgi:methionyl-tRNA formyltransferase
MRILFLGTPPVAALVLEQIVRDPAVQIVGIVTQPDRPSGRNRTLQPPAVKQRAHELGIAAPIIQPETLRDPQVVAELAALQPDVGVVMAYGEILRHDVLNIPAAGYLNIHPSLLPRWRGPAPVVGAMLADDREVGVSVMRLVARMDAGPILAQHRQPLAADARAEPLLHALCTIGADLLLQHLPDYLAGKLVPIAQDETQATYTQLIQKTDGIIDWHGSARHIERMTRAYDPWPGAITSWRGQPFRIIEAHVDSPQSKLLPGQIDEHQGVILVGCGDQTLRLAQVQPAGKRVMAAQEWWRGIQDRTHTQFEAIKSAQ